MKAQATSKSKESDEQEISNILTHSKTKTKLKAYDLSIILSSEWRARQARNELEKNAKLLAQRINLLKMEDKKLRKKTENAQKHHEKLVELKKIKSENLKRVFFLFLIAFGFG